MGKVGKQDSAPGYQYVVQERKEWEETKNHYLTLPWFLQKLDEYINTYQYNMRNQDWRDEYKLRWCHETNRKIYVKITLEEWMYWELCYLGNGPDDYDYDEPMIIPSWSLEARVVFEEIMIKRCKEIVYEVYLEKKNKMK